MPLSPEEAKLLGAMDAKLTALCTSFNDFKDKAESKQGFTRCAVHTANVENVIKSVTWIKRIMLGTFITGLGALVAKIWPGG